MRPDKRYFHLTPKGWVRKDELPFPQDRVETWVHESERLHEDAEEEIRLSRLWSDAATAPAARDALRARFAQMTAPAFAADSDW